MTKKKITILLTIILIVSLGVVGSFWWKQNMHKINAGANNKNIIMQNDIIRQYVVKNKKIDVDIDSSDWEIYRNNKIGISIKHPKTLKLSQDKNEIKIKDVKSGEWAGTIEINKDKNIELKIGGVAIEENFKPIIKWQKIGYILTQDNFVTIMRGIFKNAKEGNNQKSDLLILGYFLKDTEPIARIMIDASYKIEDNIWYGIIKSMKII